MNFWMPSKRPSGFTTMELLITLVIIGILMAIAVPSYSAYVARGQRAAAKAGLQQAAQYLERNYSTSGCYNYTSPTDCGNQSGTAVTWGFTGTPTDGTAVTYTLAAPTVWSDPNAASPAAGQYFKLVATPCGSASGACTGGSTFTDGQCGTLLLTSTGQKGINVSGSDDFTSSQASTCWQH